MPYPQCSKFLMLFRFQHVQEISISYDLDFFKYFFLFLLTDFPVIIIHDAIKDPIRHLLVYSENRLQFSGSSSTNAI